ncbi:MBL fold metallo-hydrolase [Microbulbifer pacificus]|uniref:MBL fold metallo-hydrolase n=1 Tax=Microbulbifer pacificus TaxID=407164 RepID=A0AAU0N1L9_9GAMM|nr:MBL fold metallo-hydrolase [Microbulbifer pacificus]WOX06852.1 MBL fold metallo-hydrolase [Microbulbifer pacificus]
MRRSLISLLIPLLFSIQSLCTFAEDRIAYKIEHLKDNVYRFTAGHYHSVFMVTKEGLFLTDPISEEAATYLREQLSQRFKVPIRYIAYSHNHVDHTLGGNVLAKDGATVVAHEYAAEDIKWTRAPTAIPDITFRDQLAIELGDSRVELRYHGPNNGRGSVSMRFMPANVLYVVDWIVIGRMPYRDLLGYDIHGMIHSTREVLAADPFDLFVGGHANTGTRKDVQRYLSYLEALYDAVLDGMLAGKSLETLQSEIRLPEYADLPMYEEWLPLNVAGVYKTLVEMSYFNFRTDIDAEF